MNVRRLCAWLVVAATAASSSAPLEADRQSPALSEPAHAGALPIDVVTRPWVGDFDGIVQRRLLRLLTPYSRTHYFVDRGVQRGMAYDFGMRLEQEINRRLKTTAATKVHVVFVPTARDQLYQSLIDGRGDVIASNLVVTPDSARLVDFTIPGQVNVNEILVTGPGTRALDRLDQLAGLVLHPKVVARGNASIAWAVRKSSPKLLDALNPIVEANRVGTGFGNTVLRAHLRGARQLEPNVHAGVKYVRVLIDRYFQGEPTDPLNKTLLHSPPTTAVQAGSGNSAGRRSVET
jgi:ABC-type amino acid transport substrate-binding protein